MKEYFKDQLPDAIQHAKDDFPNESCGAIIDDEYVRFKNSSDDKSKSFLILDNKFNRAYIDGKVQCVIHSHNDYDKASPEDQRQQLELEIPFGIINLKNKSVINTVFWGDQLEIQDYKGRPFFYGVYDCYALARDTMRERFNIIPPDPVREWGFWNKGKTLFEDHVEMDNSPFFKVEIEELQEGDYVFYNIYGTPKSNHIGMMCENGLVLHHFVNQISGYRPISYFREFLMYGYRYNEKWEGWNDQTIWLVG